MLNTSEVGEAIYSVINKLLDDSMIAEDLNKLDLLTNLVCELSDSLLDDKEVTS